MRPLFLSLVLLVACDKSAESGAKSAPAAPAAPAPTATAAAPSAAAGGASTPGAQPGDPSPDTVIASWTGGQVTYGDLYGEVKGQLIQKEVDYLTDRWQTQAGALDQMVTEKLLEGEVKSRGLSDVPALLKVEVEDKVTAPTEAEILSFYEVMKRRKKDAPLEEVRDQVVGELSRRKKADRFQIYLEELKVAKAAKSDMPFPENMPRVTVSVDDDPFLGAAEAKVTIVQFAEYQCPYCGKANPTVERVLKEYDGKVKMVFRDYPLPGHSSAIPAAIAANCAIPQGKYWELHTLLMKNQTSLDDASLKGFAQQVGVDMAKWEQCRLDPAVADEITRDAKEGSAAGVSGTPAFFINGIPLSGALPFEMFKSVIDRELTRS